MKDLNGKVGSCESRNAELESGGLFSHPNPAIRPALQGAPAHGEVERRLLIACPGDTLMGSDNDRDSVEIRLRRVMADLERRIHDGENCFAEEYFRADPELAENIENALDLILTEVDAYRDAGRPRPREDYYRRYSQWRDKLKR